MGIGNWDDRWERGEGEGFGQTSIDIGGLAVAACDFGVFFLFSLALLHLVRGSSTSSTGSVLSLPLFDTLYEACMIFWYVIGMLYITSTSRGVQWCEDRRG